MANTPSKEDRLNEWRSQWSTPSSQPSAQVSSQGSKEDRLTEWRNQWSKPAVETNPSPATYKAGSAIVDALAGITGKKAEPYTPKPVVNPEPTRQQRRAEMLDERFTPAPVKTPEPPTMPNRIVSDAGMNFSNSAQALFNAAPVASERGQGLNPVTPYETQKQQETAQNDFNNLNRQIQEYDLALGMADTPEAQAEINAKRAPLVEQRERLLQENPSITDYDKAQSKAFWGAINTGNDAALSRITTFLDKTIGLGDALQEVFYMFGINRDNPIKAFNNYVHDVAEHNQAYYREQTKGDPTAQAMLNYGSQAVAAVPAMVFAMATAGASAPTTAGLEATAYLNSLSGAEQAVVQVSNAVNTMMANPSWQFSFAQEAGSAYESALDKGLDEAEAAAYSMLYGYLSATVEVGGTSETAGGLEQFYDDVKKGKVSNGLIARAKEIVGEIGEENIQGILERGLLGVFGQDTKLVSNDPNQNAIIKPNEMAEEAKGAAVVSALLGIPGAVSNINSRATVEPESAPVPTQSVDATLTPEMRASQIVRNPQARTAFQDMYGVPLPESLSNTEAERIVSQILRAQNAPQTTVVENAPVEAAPVEAPVETAPTYTEAQERVIDILTKPDGVQFSDANAILSNNVLWQAYQQLFPNVDTNQSRNALKNEIRNTDIGTMATEEQANPIVEETAPVEDTAPIEEPAPAVNTEAEAQAETAPTVATETAEETAPQETAETTPKERGPFERTEVIGEARTRERGGSQTLREDPRRNAELRAFKDKHRDLYKQLRNSETLNKALDVYETGYDNALLEVRTAIKNAQAGQKLAPEIVPLSKLVCDDMAAMGDVEGANQIYSDIAAELTYAGQLGQANAILKGASPTAKADALVKTLTKIAKEANSPMTEERIREISNEYRKAESDEARDAIVDEAMQEIADMSPTTLREAFTSLRYLNMLGNFKTQFRNILGNTGMLAMSRIKNRVLAMEQTALNAVSQAIAGKDIVSPTATVTTDAKMYKEALEYYKEDKADTLGERKYSDVAEKNRAISDKKTIFKWNWKGDPTSSADASFRAIANAPMWVLEKYRQATNWAMEAGDAIFTKVTYAQTLADYAKAQGYDSLSEVDPDTLRTMRDYAIQQAQESTFRDTNAVSNFASTFDQNWSPFMRKISQGVIPFRKTPANVGVRMEEYSPLGLINTAVDAVRAAKGDSDVTLNDVLDDLAKTITGTGLTALGYVLAKHGLARGKEKDKKLEAFEKQTQGLGDYSLVLDDGTTVSLDWLTPESGAFFLGVEAAELFDDGMQSDDFLSLLGTTNDIALNMSFLSGIQDALQNVTSYNGDISALPQFLLNSYLSYMGQAFTNSLVGQAEQASEQYRRTTYSNPDEALPSTLQYTLGKFSAKTPGWEYNQADYIDAWGRKQDNGEAGERIAEAFLSPAYINEDRSTSIDNELKRLYESTGENVIPAVSSRSTKVDNERLTADEYELYQTTLGQESFSLVSEILKGKGYDQLTDAEKADLVSKAYSYAKAEAARAVQESRGVEAEQTSTEKQLEKIRDIRKAGDMSWPEYYQFNKDLDEYCNGSMSMDELFSYLQEKDVKNAEKLFSTYYPDAKETYADRMAKEEEATSAGWESSAQYAEDKKALDEYKKEQKNEYDTAGTPAAAQYIRNADRTDDQKDALMQEVGKAYNSVYTTVRQEKGLSPDEVIDLLFSVDTVGSNNKPGANGSFTQAEVKSYYREHPEDEWLCNIIWDVIKSDKTPAWDEAKNKK